MPLLNTTETAPVPRTSGRSGIVLGAVLIFMLYGLGYTLNVRRNILFENQFAYVPLVQQMEDGTLTLRDLWMPFGEHRILGYKLLFLANATLFRLNSLIEALLMPLTFGIGSLILFSAYRRTLEGTADRFVQLSFLSMALLFNAPSQYATFANGMIVGLAIGSTLFLVTFLAADRFLRQRTRANLAIYAISAVGTVLLFGSAYSTGFTMAVLAVAAAAGTVDRRERAVLPIWPAVLLGAPLLAALVIYMIPWAGSPVQNAELGQNLKFVLMHGFGSLKFIAMMMAATVLSDVVYEGNVQSAGALVFVGVLVGLGHAWAVRAFLRERLWRSSWIPLLLIAHSAAVMLAVLLGRSRYGEQYAFYQQYFLQTKLGTIGALWVFFLRSRTASRFAGRWLLAPAAIATACQLYSVTCEWGVMQYRRDLFERGLDATLTNDEKALHVQPGEPMNALMAQTDETVLGLDIARRHGLSTFAACRVPAQRAASSTAEPRTPGVELLDGWYQPEGGGRWIASVARSRVQTGPAGRIVVQGFVPVHVYEDVYHRRLEMILRSGPKEIRRQAIGPEGFVVEIDVCAECEMTLTVELTNSFVPKDVGQGLDARELSVVITKVSAE